MSKGFAIALFLSVFLVFSVQASVVSFYVIETGVSLEGTVNQHSRRWESAFMDVFFEAGYIVSNAPILRLETRPSDEILRTISFDTEEARGAGIDYMLIAQLDYNPDTTVPGNINLFIFRVIPHEKVFEMQITGKRYRSTREEIDDLKTIIRELVPYISE
jgi:hypothetical protein